VLGEQPVKTEESSLCNAMKECSSDSRLQTVKIQDSEVAGSYWSRDNPFLFLSRDHYNSKIPCRLRSIIVKA
jgi:hypothetical protein